jgi:CzcA family heavy metal efflux pump
MTRFTDILQEHARAIYLVFILIALGGYLAFKNLPSDVYPNLSFPRIAVIANMGDAAPERVLLSVTRVLEEAAGQVYRVRWVRSKTIRGSTELSVDFQDGTDMVFALHQLQARIAEVQGKLPAGVNTTIELVTPAIFPVLSYNVTTEALTQADLYSICRYQLQPALSRVPGVARVQIQGGDIPEVSVQVNPDQLKSYRLSLSQIADALRKTNQIQVVGRMDNAHQQNLVVATGEALDLKELGELLISTSPSGSPVYLKDVATINFGYADRTSLVSIQKRPGLVINIFRQPSSNVVAVSEGVRTELKLLKKSLPLGLEIKPAYDESNLVRYAMTNVRDAIEIGICLIVVVLLLSLRSWKGTLIAALTIPLSALAAFACLYFTGQSLNLMSLGGLAIAIGLVIDDAIVVVENISRQLQETGDPRRAVQQALKELVGPVTSSTATTVVVFLPLGLLSGVAGQFFTSLTITLAAAVIFSLLLALTLTPLLAVQMFGAVKNTPSHSEESLIGSIYGKILRFVFWQPWLIGLMAIGLVAGSLNLYGKLGSDFLPAMDEGSYVLDYLAPPGTSLSDMDKFALKLEGMLAKTPEVQTWTRRTGAELGLFATQTNKGDILVVLKPGDQRKRSINQIMKEQREAANEALPQLDVDFHQILQDQLNDLSGAPKPVEVRIYGDDPAVLRRYSEDVQKQVENVPGVVDLTNTSAATAPEVDLRVDPLRAGRIGLSPSDVANQVQDSMLGRVATQIRQGDRLINVRVRLNDAVRLSPRELDQIPIVGTNGAVLPLYAVANLAKKSVGTEIYCENQQRYVSVEGELEGRDLGSAVKEIQEKLNSFKLPPGYRLDIAGLYTSQKQSFNELLSVLSLATLLVYLLLVIQFRSLLQPLAILVAIPLAIFGVEVGLYLTKTPLNVSSFMGVILLVGLVVKNGIILLDYTNKLQQSGMSLEDALIRAGTVRLRPIMMTTLCTLLGLFPLAIGLGTGAELQKPLAIAVIGGLSLSTIFTLIFVPVIFRWLKGERIADRPEPLASPAISERH